MEHVFNVSGSLLQNPSQIDSILNHSAAAGVADGSPLSQFLKTFLSCAMLIIFSELGDKTFFIVIILSAKNHKYNVFAGSFCALITMTILSIMMGFAFAHIASPGAIQLITFCIYAVCGAYILYDAYNMDEQSSSADTYKEASNDVDIIGSKIRMEEIPTMMINRKKSPTLEKLYNILKIVFKISKRYLSPILLQAFFLVFLAEWGDRSQIATVFMAQKNIIPATIGAIFGHLLCTLCALMCGWLVSSVSMRKINVVSGIIFISFAIYSLY